ncbi:M23 family metallopeptidase [Shewanella intestini]|uniref:M23 family metallopeptidase n=1 Tax=Shewanella intestini TaxID=2017544 RepID=A0ABS5I8A2_9GAMM|nr:MULTISPECIES: M23 family metallopeptidase [Shewanella]MBR9729515.1 M23 family metallopeptidase [Shewanella intestini]MRG37556.1 peptidoglycan DD-metalloendopeptidase family protein [Shewanella sp. XMDDZSB0408]
MLKNPLSLALMLFTCSMTAQAQIVMQGQFEQGALVRGSVPAGSQIALNEKDVHVTPDGHFAIGFERDAPLSQLLKVTYPDGLTQLKPLILEKKHYKVDRVNGISKKIMKPNPVAQKRARQDAQQVRTARDTFSQQDAFMQDFIWPVTGRISGVYGSQRVYNGKPGNPHFGVDVARPTGTPVVAPAGGIVTLAESDMFYSGGTMIIDHGYGVSSTFLHLSKINCNVGDKVTQGQHVAEIGATGRATGPHLDWRINWFQMRLDPVTVVPPMKQVLAIE